MMPTGQTYGGKTKYPGYYSGIGKAWEKVCDGMNERCSTIKASTDGAVFGGDARGS